jgi:hypothetical protein
MADTLGGLIDKLITIDMKMWNNQEFLYEVRRLSFEEFKQKYTDEESKQADLFDSIKKCCDLNVQRNQSGNDLDAGKFIQRKHKTY